MNLRIVLLAAAAFVVGTVELIVGGILDLITADLHISVSAAGQFITVFSIAFALSAPILMNLTAKVERKTLYLTSLGVFLLSNVMIAFSSSYSLILFARILSAMSGAIIIVLSITLAPRLVSSSHKGRALGIIYMGISGSLVLGVPIGMLIGNTYGWRAPFLLIAGMSALAILGIAVFLKKSPPAKAIPLREQLASLRDSKIVSGQLISFLMLTGHLTLYAYFAPYVQSLFPISPGTLSLVYFLFGIAAVSGGGLGGWISDHWGTERALIVIVICFAIVMFILPFAAEISFYVFLVAVMVWSALSWALSPAQQTYLMQSAPKTADIQLSLNTSVMHLGVASGSFIGGVVIQQSSVANNSWVGGILVLIALGSAIYSLTRRSQRPSTVEE
ncbi:MFS transporter [Siminovitchia terrae]|uniref:MFS transporter n=1 Tax=Siminovitchia terrae TaxID=1914933 RepID=A0ABQ4KV97_SIMTE|nr:MFS transporter [Siminovitchia terrae]GIN93667.1 MFS transporter [Siminovitchia terrae]GIN95963.1 MFS transporter [Siminovitchia terrae]